MVEQWSHKWLVCLETSSGHVTHQTHIVSIGMISDFFSFFWSSWLFPITPLSPTTEGLLSCLSLSLNSDRRENVAMQVCTRVLKVLQGLCVDQGTRYTCVQKTAKKTDKKTEAK